MRSIFLSPLLLLFCKVALAHPIHDDDDDVCPLEKDDAMPTSQPVEPAMTVSSLSKSKPSTSVSPSSTLEAGASENSHASSITENQSTPHAIKAPLSTEPVPKDAAVYTPKNGLLDVEDFTTWVNSHIAKPDATPSHWIRVAPGEYKYSIKEGGKQQTVMFWGARNSENPSQPGPAWTIDLRGSTFHVPIIKETDGNPPAAIYVAQCNDLRILGGTFWIDTGKELYTQGRITSYTSTDATNHALATVTITVDPGYDFPAWSNLTNSNWRVTDTSDPTSYKPINTTFWGPTNPPHLNAEARTVTVSVNAEGLHKGLYVSLGLGVSTPSTISAEMDSNTTVQGLTTNGGFFQYGLDAVLQSGEPQRKPQRWIDCVITNPPLREKGQAARVMGPTLLNAGSGVGGGVVYSGIWNAVNGGDDPKGEGSKGKGSFWQSTGCDCKADYLPLDEKAFAPS